MSAMQQPGPNSYYAPQPTTPAPYPGAGSYMGNLPPPSTAPGGIPPGNPTLANLPPNILALLQSAQQQQQRPPMPPGQSFGMPMNTPPPAAAQPPPGGTNPQYQQLMAYLVSLMRYKNSLDAHSTFLSKHKPLLKLVGNNRLRSHSIKFSRRLTRQKKKFSEKDVFFRCILFPFHSILFVAYPYPL